MNRIFKNLSIIAAVTAAVGTFVVSSDFDNKAAGAVECTSSSEVRTVIPCGTPFGIKMLTDGVVVTDFGCVDASASQVSPAEAAGIRKGDIIITANGVDITDSNSLAEAVQLSPESCELWIIRDGGELTVTAKALYSQKDGEYKLGLWTKDSCAGIGTMTFYDPETGTFGGLGHAISDSATGIRLPLSSGEITSVTITDVIKGGKGYPGELCGAFISDTEMGTLEVNSECGVFGKMEMSPILNEAVEIASPDEVETGEAVILTTIYGMMPKEYDIEIVSVDTGGNSPTRNMTVKITDKELLSATGGIVQGMSGSPIIQNGKLIGAITHVLVNDSAMGYGIFAENMIESAEAA